MITGPERFCDWMTGEVRTDLPLDQGGEPGSMTKQARHRGVNTQKLR